MSHLRLKLIFHNAFCFDDFQIEVIFLLSSRYKELDQFQVTLDTRFYCCCLLVLLAHLAEGHESLFHAAASVVRPA